MRFNVPIYLVSPKRTAIGSMLGALSEVPSPELAATVIKGILAESGVTSNHIDQVILGCVLTAGLGQAPARQAAIKAGLPVTVNALTINKVCSSGLKAVILAANEIALGSSQAIIAGGMENMSLSPYLLPKLRAGAKLGPTQAEDSIVKDGLWDVYNNFHMGNCAELCAKKYDLSRDEQDRYALQSYDRATASTINGDFKSEIVPVVLKSGEFNTDEEVGKLKREKVSQLKAVFEKDGTVTAANASSINDGASAMLVCSEEFVSKYNLKPLAKMIAHNTHSREPEWFGIAPVDAVKKLLVDISSAVPKIDLFEVNEAFSSVALACQRELEIPSEKLNICGGAVALGHPIGASGARILTTLVHSLHRTKGRSGIAAICNGGGEATAIAIEAI